MRCEEEFQRMLYVTLTRAKRLLVVPDGTDLYAGQPPNFQGLARWRDLDLPALFDAPPPAPEKASLAVHDTDPGPPYFEENTRRLHRAAAISQQVPRRVLPSGLVHAKHATPAEAHTDVRLLDAQGHSLDAEDDRLLAAEDAGLLEGTVDDGLLAGIGGIDYGNWWHAVLERYPWRTADPDERAAYLRGERARVAPSVAWTARAAEELERFAASRAHAEFVKEGEVFLPEMPFSHPRHEGEWVEGIMDLVVLTRGGKELWIVDWKTDRRRATDPDDAAFLRRLSEKYAPQLQAYAEVFARGLGRPADRLLLYSTALGETVQVPLEQSAKQSVASAR